jgi:phosphoribosylamine---glycine ligase
VFHAGTQNKKQNLVSDGGRVLGVTAVGETFDAAIDQAYAAVDSIHFEGAYYRQDIGDRVRTAKSASS